jgi:hypothetical protein
VSDVIAPQPTTGKPRLEEKPEGAAAAQASPPPSQLAGDAGTPAEAVAPAPAGWTPEQAALATTGLHNGVGVVLYKHPEQRKAHLADPRELDDAAPSLARVYDKLLPFLQPGAGPLGLIGDLLISGQAVVQMEVRHFEEVRKATARIERELERGAAHPRPAAAPPAASNGHTPPPAAAPPVTHWPAAEEPDVVIAGEDEGFRFDGDLSAFLHAQPDRGRGMLNNDGGPNPG